jgi:hypothetical protein
MRRNRSHGKGAHDEAGSAKSISGSSGSRAAIGLGLAFVVLSILSAELVLRQVYAKKDAEIRQGMKLLSSPLYASIAVPGSTGIHRTEEFNVTLRANRLGFRERDLWLDHPGRYRISW